MGAEAVLDGEGVVFLVVVVAMNDIKLMIGLAIYGNPGIRQNEQQSGLIEVIQLHLQVF